MKSYCFFIAVLLCAALVFANDNEKFSGNAPSSSGKPDMYERKASTVTFTLPPADKFLWKRYKKNSEPQHPKDNSY